MKRFLLMLVICVSSFMIYTNNVKADTCNNVYISQLDSIYNLSSTFSGGTSYFDYTFPSSFNYNNNYDYMKFRILWGYTNSTGIISNIDIVTTCQGYNNYNNVSNGTITYGDGTTASISQMDYERVCSSWSTYLSSTTGGNITYSYQPNVNNVAVAFRVDNNYWHYCDVDSNGLVICKKPAEQQVSLNAFRFMFGTNGYNSTLKYGVVSDVVQYCKSDSSTFSQINSNTNEIKNEIKNDNVSGAESSADDLKNNSAFQDNTGLSGVISMPLTFVNSLTNTCQPINLNIPYMDVDVTIPCMQSVITDKMPLLANLIKIIVNGFIVYRILLDIFQIVRNAKNPEDDRIEVLDL